MKRRTDNHQGVHFRVNRFHRTNGSWFFVTREGANFGPFESKKYAETELEQFLGMKNSSRANS